MLGKIIKHCKGSASYYFRKNVRAASGEIAIVMNFLFYIQSDKQKSLIVSCIYSACFWHTGNPVEVGVPCNTCKSFFCPRKSRTIILLFCALWKAMFICHCPSSWAVTALSFYTLLFHVVMESIASWHYLRGP